jgi:hypothetical protein
LNDRTLKDMMKNMTANDEGLQRRLREAFPPPEPQELAHDLWHRVELRMDAPAPWSWVDVGLAACAAVALFIVPGSFMLIAYHL